MDSSSEIVIHHFKDQQPGEKDFFCFVCPILKDRWEVGWRDWYHYRVEGGESYRHDDPSLTYWFLLPKIPKESNA